MQFWTNGLSKVWILRVTQINLSLKNHEFNWVSFFKKNKKVGFINPREIGYSIRINVCVYQLRNMQGKDNGGVKNGIMVASGLLEW